METNAIGHDWKTYVPQQGYVLENERLLFCSGPGQRILGASCSPNLKEVRQETLVFGKVSLTGANAVIETTADDLFVLYPNPVALQGSVNLQWKGRTTSNHEVAIFGLDGTLKFRRSISGQMTQISLESLSKGMYIVRVTNGNGGLTTKPLIVQ